MLAPIQKLSKPTIEIKTINKVTINLISKTINNKVFNINWIDNEHIIYQTYKTTYIINLKNYKSYKVNILLPIPSPDGKYIAYITKKNKMVTLYVLDFTTQKKQKILCQNNLEIDDEYYFKFTDIEYIWTNDSKKLLIVIKQSNKTSILITDLNYKPKFIKKLDFGICNLTIADNKNLFFSTTFQTAQKNDFKFILYHLNLETKKLILLKKFNLFQFLNPEISFDSKNLVITYDAVHNNFDYINDLGLLDIKTKKITRLTKMFKSYTKKWFNNDIILALRMYGPYSQLFSITPGSL